ncbi:hypothetical protein SEA_NHAGOS_61 [Gordonia phage NHagos]|nr:hypothetical protein SEA_NHAGOS_61 [Gordonia phage NHagos]
MSDTPQEILDRLTAEVDTATRDLLMIPDEHADPIRAAGMVAVYTGVMMAGRGAELAVKIGGPQEPVTLCGGIMSSLYAEPSAGAIFELRHRPGSAMADHCPACAEISGAFVAASFRMGMHQLGIAWAQLAMIEPGPRTILQVKAVERSVLDSARRRIEEGP